MPRFSVPVVPLTSDEITRLATKSRIAAGFHALIIASAEEHIPKDPSNVNVMSKLTLRPLADPNDAASAEKRVSVTKWITWPLRNPEVSGHQPPQGRQAREAAEFLAAFFPSEVPAWPAMVDGRLTHEGRTITKAEADAIERECLTAAANKAAEVYSDHNLLVGLVAYGVVSHPPAKDDGRDPFPEVKGWAAEPGDRELSEERVEELAPPEAEAPAPKASTKKGKR